MRVRTAVLALVMGTPVAGQAQEPWPGARCYTLRLGAWVRSDSGAPEREPAAPDLIVLDSARVGVPLGYSDAPDTVRRLVHAMVRDTNARRRKYLPYYGADRWFSGWQQPAPDSVTVALGTGYGGLDFQLRVRADRLLGVATSWVDYGRYWTAPVAGRRTRCPATPPHVGRLRLAVTEERPQETPYDFLMPQADLEVSTEAAVPCGSWVDYTLVRRGALLVVTVQGLATGVPCDAPPRPATTTLGAMLGPGRYTVIIGMVPVGAPTDTNRFTLTVTDSTMQLTALRSTFVTADERPLARRAHNLFTLRCGHRRATALCDEIEQWLVALPGISRVDPFPNRRQINEDVWVALFRYDATPTLSRVRACMRWVADRVRDTAGVYVTVRTWLGEEIEATSARPRGSEQPIPANVTAGGPCVG